ncbi:thrombospondin-2-like [Tubulanus polymorphus]|uniref:thrombospondin-2-like n=1 Tax=Tubulanus polymorphus TaxID=672921 RepID=UPI003DA55EF4
MDRSADFAECGQTSEFAGDPIAGACGGGLQKRTRNCQGVADGGKTCAELNLGGDVEKRACATTPCIIDGNYSAWGAWTACSNNCGKGTKSRKRICTNPVPANGGKTCAEQEQLGGSEQTLTCTGTVCPVNGNWGIWSGWSPCSTPCGAGIMSRRRLCNSPPASNGGLACLINGSIRKVLETKTRVCQQAPCPGEYFSKSRAIGELFDAV